MSVLLTSFKHWFSSGDSYMHQVDKAYSIAVYQPNWYPQLPKVDIFDIRENGRWIRPRDFIPDMDDVPTIVGGGTSYRAPDEKLIHEYHDALLRLFEQRYHKDARGTKQAMDLEEILGGKYFGGSVENNVAFCCWCPYDKAAQRQLRDYGSFVCHSWPVETFLTNLGVEVLRDHDRLDMVS